MLKAKQIYSPFYNQSVVIDGPPENLDNKCCQFVKENIQKVHAVLKSKSEGLKTPQFKSTEQHYLEGSIAIKKMYPRAEKDTTLRGIDQFFLHIPQVETFPCWILEVNIK